MGLRPLVLFFILVLTAWPGRAADMIPASALAGTDVAIVVNPDVPIDNMTLAELRRIMLGDRQFWTGSLRVTLLVRAPVSRERDIVLKTIYQMTEAQFRQYWIGKVFRAETASGPRIVYSNEMATEMVATTPGAITFADASQIPKNVKVVSCNGLMPGEKGYPLH